MKINETKNEDIFFSNVFGLIRKFLNIKSKRLSDTNENLQKKESEADKNGKYFSRNTVDN